MLILKCEYKSREININSLEFSCCFDSSKFWQAHSLIHKLIEIPHRNMYNNVMPRVIGISFMSPVLKKLLPIKKVCFPKLDETPFQKEIGARSLWIQKMKIEVFILI